MPYYGLYIPVKGGGNAAAGANVATSTTNAAAAAAVNTLYSSAGAGTANANNFLNDMFTADATPKVFQKKSQALELLKKHKDARLREFIKEDDAINYAQTGYEEVPQNKYPEVKTPSASLEKAAFRAPTKQELIAFRKVIEAGDYDRVNMMIWENPRYLVSSGDTPTTLKEGYRYNALHVCAIAQRPKIAELILQTVSDPKFVELLTGGQKCDEKMYRELCANLLDYYLNMPEKGRNETPLHLAAKQGAAKVIEVLISYPQCKMTHNNMDQLPREIINQRATFPDMEAYKKIESLLEERFYVPVLRSSDGALPPTIGKPFSANNPPNLNSDHLAPELKIEALAGPMNEQQAKQFHRRWKTPPRIGSNCSSPIMNSPLITPIKSRANSTPTKTPLRTPNNIESNNFDSPKGVIQKRALFNNTAQSSPSELKTKIGMQQMITSIQNFQPEDQNGVDMHTNVNIQFAPDADQTETDGANTTLDKNNSVFVKDDEKENEQTNVDKQNEKDCELNESASESNNNEHKLAFPNNKVHITKIMSSLCPRTPQMMMKKEAFYTYRVPKCDSPMPFFEGSNSSFTSLCNDADHLLTSSPGFKERHIKNTDVEKGLEIIGRELAKEQKVGWREHWDFLGQFADLSSEEGLQSLEKYFIERQKEIEEHERKLMRRDNTKAPSAILLDNVCNALEKLALPNLRIGTEESGLSNFNGNDINAGTNSTPVVKATNPYTCVEKSLQVFAKRITKTIVHNIENVVSINDALLSELKRLKSLIFSFKEDERFLGVNFAKVHSRIGNLISFYLQNSQEVTDDIKEEILGIMHHLITVSGERSEHVECVCSRIIKLLEKPIDQVLPENIKTEDICAKVWLTEYECDCQWETNFSRKTSRRLRIEARIRSIKSKNSEKNVDGRGRTFSTGSSDGLEDAEEDKFWSECENSDVDSEADLWFTPPESPVPDLEGNDEENDEEKYKVYIYGTEPTKRDLDVLNAIFHINLDKTKYPYISAWKAAITCFPTDQMDYFPSPAIVKKTQSFAASIPSTSSAAKKVYAKTPIPQTSLAYATALNRIRKLSENSNTPKRSSQQLQITPAAAETSEPEQPQTTPTSLPFAKRLFMSPARSKPNIPDAATPVAETSSRPTIFTTPLNKIRGLFSSYRERIEESPMSVSSASPAFLNERSGSDNSNNLSLLNISASE